jgi:hypothetical protein
VNIIELAGFCAASHDVQITNKVMKRRSMTLLAQLQLVSIRGLLAAAYMQQHSALPGMAA